MKYYFILNPLAGKNAKTLQLISPIRELCKKYSLEYVIYNTRSSGDATTYVSTICAECTTEARIFACGGDGTVNEVASACMGYKNISFGVIPLGSGNDFVKNFDTIDNFMNIEAQLFGESVPIDAIKVNDRYVFNMCNVGFDAEVVHNAIRFKKKPGISGAAAYLMSVFYTLSQELGKEVTITIDGGEPFQDNVLLCAIGNGSRCGGMFNALPTAKVNDGIMNVCLVKKLTRPRFLSILGSYKKGTHFEKKSTKDVIFHYPCKRFTIQAKDDIAIALDGEVVMVKNIDCSIIENGINFIMPKQ